jgi:hypothetical protein
MTTPTFIKLSFSKAKESDERFSGYTAIGKPVVTMELDGQRHSLKLAARQLFESYLEERLGESLNCHLWRFVPMYLDEDRSNNELPVNVPLLSEELLSIPNANLSHVGTELLFYYDEGSPTLMIAKVEGISTTPMSPTGVDHAIPYVFPTGVTDSPPNKRRRISGEITMDQAFPHLSQQLLRRRGVTFDLGRGCAPWGDFGGEDRTWAILWGGGRRPAMDRSLIAEDEFTNADEAFVCFEKAIEKQLGPDHPCSESRKKYRRPDNGEIEVEHRKSKEFDIVVNCYPRSTPTDEYKDEWNKMMTWDSFETRKIISNKHRNHFNFSLPANWRTFTSFSFIQTFPKCAAWLTYPSTICYTMTIERGVLYAKKGKGKRAKVIHETKQCTTLDDMFADMEARIVIPKSWRY